MWRQGLARGAWLVTLAPASAFLALGGQVGAAGEAGLPTDGAATELLRDAPPRIQCGMPETLRLRRFEDGSAQLLCGRRVIVRISVPG